MTERPWGRVLVLWGVVAFGLAQTVLTYSDAGGPAPMAPLSAKAQRGLALFRANNCRACHQIFGFGGFLGPDLTNVAATKSANELEPLLTVGRKQMPAFHFTAKQRRDIYAFLKAVDAAAQSQPAGLRNRRPVDRATHFQALADAYLGPSGRPLPPSAGRGLAVMQAQGCGSCHVPLTQGVWNSPDLSLVTDYLSEEAITTTIQNGRDAMPSFKVSAAEAKDVAAFLRWMSAHRDALQATDAELCDREPFRWSEIPWYEYR